MILKTNSAIIRGRKINAKVTKRSTLKSSECAWSKQSNIFVNKMKYIKYEHSLYVGPNSSYRQSWSFCTVVETDERTDSSKQNVLDHSIAWAESMIATQVRHPIGSFHIFFIYLFITPSSNNVTSVQELSTPTWRLLLFIVPLVSQFVRGQCDRDAHKL